MIDKKSIEWDARIVLHNPKEVKMSGCTVFWSNSTNWIMSWRNYGMFEQRTGLVFLGFQGNEYGHCIINA